MKRVPRWLLQGIGVFSPMMREIPEMMYQFEVPYVIDDARFRSVFGVGATPIEKAVSDTVAWASARYGVSRVA